MFKGVLRALFVISMAKLAAVDMYVGGMAGPAGLNGKHHIGGVSAIVGGVLGLESEFLEFGYSALEGNVAWDSLNTKEFEGVRVKNPIVYGLDGKLGMMFGNATIYTLGGVTAGEWKHSHTSTKVSGKVGGGIRIPVYPNFKFDMQYSYNWYGSDFQQQKVLFSLNWAFWSLR